jgi:hypothetical protein
VEDETAAMEDQGFSSETEMNMKRATSYRVFVKVETIAMPIAPKITYWSMKKKNMISKPCIVKPVVPRRITPRMIIFDDEAFTPEGFLSSQ